MFEASMHLFKNISLGESKHVFISNRIRIILSLIGHYVKLASPSKKTFCQKDPEISVVAGQFPNYLGWSAMSASTVLNKYSVFRVITIFGCDSITIRVA